MEMIHGWLSFLLTVSIHAHFIHLKIRKYFNTKSAIIIHTYFIYDVKWKVFYSLIHIREVLKNFPHMREL